MLANLSAAGLRFHVVSDTVEGAADELLDHLGALFGSLSVGEESTARGMIASGAHLKAVVAKIAAGRCSAGIMDRSARGGQA